MRELKSESSAWIHKELGLRGFAWQEGYGAFTVSASSCDQVRAYVLGQERHHRATTFQQEYVAMLQRCLVEYDERYLWVRHRPVSYRPDAWMLLALLRSASYPRAVVTGSYSPAVAGFAAG